MQGQHLTSAYEPMTNSACCPKTYSERMLSGLKGYRLMAARVPAEHA
jgi:hypothetical protein